MNKETLADSTPRTDREAVDDRDFCISMRDWVKADFCRELERELNAKQKEIDSLHHLLRCSEK